MVVVGIRFDDVEVKVVSGSFHVKRHEYRGRRGKFQLQDEVNKLHQHRYKTLKTLSFRCLDFGL